MEWRALCFWTSVSLVTVLLIWLGLKPESEAQLVVTLEGILRRYVTIPMVFGLYVGQVLQHGNVRGPRREAWWTLLVLTFIAISFDVVVPDHGFPPAIPFAIGVSFGHLV